MNHLLVITPNRSEILPLLPFIKSQGFSISIVTNLEQAYKECDSHPPQLVILESHALKEQYRALVGYLKDHDLSATIYSLRDDQAQKNEVSENQKNISTPLNLEKMRVILKTVGLQKTIHGSIRSPLLSNFHEMIGDSPVMKNLCEMIKRVASTSASVFIVGQSGTGKELAAKAIHEYSPRKNQPYIAINCATLPSELICSELFGHEKGSFTGAHQAHKGYFEQASGGTLFLDEVTETSQEFQVNLLRVLETNMIYPVGGKRQIEVDVRIIASTNRNLKSAIQQGVLREDLFYRLNVFPLFMPDLNQRKEDIPLLATHFIHLFKNRYGKEVQLTEAAMKVLRNMHYRGNVRQLKNILYRAYILADQKIEPKYIDCSEFETGFNIDPEISTIISKIIAAVRKNHHDDHQVANALHLSSEEFVTLVNSVHPSSPSLH